MSDPIFEGNYAEAIAQANAGIQTVNIKGKDYAEVFQRVTAFRKVFPRGSIETVVDYLTGDIGDRIIGMTARAMDEEGRLLATGHAEERESFSYINKTSFIENCETSAVGRALGMAGFGIAQSMASKEEVENAINNQGKTATVKQLDAFRLGYTEGERARIRQYYGKDRDEDLAQDIVKQYIADRKDEIEKRKQERDKRVTGLDISTEQEMKPY
jgi:hypothetical protein